MSRSRDLANLGDEATGGLVKADIGLGNVDNTSDANKPVSTAQQTEIDKLAYQGEPHIIPGVLYPAVDGKDINGTALSSYTYGDLHTATGVKYYYTNIKGSKPIKDPRIGGHFGSQRHKFKSLQLLEQETATHGKNVYSVDGREWIRAVGDIEIQNSTNGLIFNINDTTTFFEITGFFNQFNWLEYLAQSGSARNRWILSVDGTTTTTESANLVNNDSPLGGRYVDAVSVRNINTGLTTPRIVTIKMTTNSASNNAWAGGCELIAQDLSGTDSPNRSKIKFPAQSVVSYGKKHEITETNHHYDPFNGFTSGNLSAVQALGIDTDTSLGLSKWLPSDAGTTYYRPFNGGRIIKWVDSSGTIKTSVNMMPPNAKSIANSASPTNAFATRTTASHFGTNNAMNSFEAGTDLDSDQLSEVAKTFHFREFGNGNANAGPHTGSENPPYADASMLTSSEDDIAYVMDDGLTSLTGKNAVAHDSTTAGLAVDAVNDFLYLTFIGTGFSLRQIRTANTPNDQFTITVDGVDVKTGQVFSGTDEFHIVQNLPYGSHVVKLHKTFSNYITHITEFTFYQPKKPPISEDAVVLCDYMLMADFVPQSVVGVEKISKGTRLLSISRDVFFDGATPTFSLSSAYPEGFASYSNTNGYLQKLPFFGSGVINRFESNSGGSAGSVLAFTNDGTNFSGGTFFGDASNNELAQNTASANGHFGGIHSLDIGTYTSKLANTTTTYFRANGYEVVTPIHTSFHYTDGNKTNPKTGFETPFLNELVGGDRNLEQHTLVCSPDGKNWDELTRDTSYIGNLLLTATPTATHSDSGGVNIYDEFRGSSYSGIVGRDHFNKDFAIAYDRFICLVSGQYEINVRNYTNSAGPNVARIYINGAEESRGYNIEDIGTSTHIYSTKLNRGDYVQVFGKSTADVTMNFIQISRV